MAKSHPPALAILAMMVVVVVVVVVAAAAAAAEHNHQLSSNPLQPAASRFPRYVSGRVRGLFAPDHRRTARCHGAGSGSDPAQGRREGSRCEADTQHGRGMVELGCGGRLVEG